MKLLLYGASALAALSSVAAETKGEVQEYRVGELLCEGYLARPQVEAVEPVPGVLVVHDWTGHNPFARKQAETLATLGYVAFAADLYGKGVRASGPEEAGKLAEPFYKDPALFRTRMTAALDHLRAQPGVDARRLGSIGFCFGGSASLELARAGGDVQGVVSFHGGLKTLKPAVPTKVRCQILVLHGNLDPHVPPADVAAFMEEMNAAKVSYKLVGFPNAVHAFTNPEAGTDPAKGAAYSPEAARHSFNEMKRFFSEMFSPPVSVPLDTAAGLGEELLNL